MLYLCFTCVIGFRYHINMRKPTFLGEIPQYAVYDIVDLHLLLLFEVQEDGRHLIRPIPDETFGRWTKSKSRSWRVLASIIAEHFVRR